MLNVNFFLKPLKNGMRLKNGPIYIKNYFKKLEYTSNFIEIKTFNQGVNFF